MKKSAYQKAMDRMNRETDRAVAQVAKLAKLYAQMQKENNSKVSS